MLSVDIGEPASTVRSFAEEQNLTFPILLDSDQTVAQTYGVRSVPYSLFIDRKGVIRKRHIGPMSESIVEEVLSDLL